MYCWSPTAKFCRAGRTVTRHLARTFHNKPIRSEDLFALLCRRLFQTHGSPMGSKDYRDEDRVTNHKLAEKNSVIVLQFKRSDFAQLSYFSLRVSNGKN